MMATVNDKDRVSTCIKIQECYTKRDNYLQWKTKSKEFERVRGLQDHSKKEGNPDIIE